MFKATTSRFFVSNRVLLIRLNSAFLDHTLIYVYVFETMDSEKNSTNGEIYYTRRLSDENRKKKKKKKLKHRASFTKNTGEI